MENIEYSFGAQPSKKDIRDYKLNAQALSAVKVPSSLLLKHVPIKNQGAFPTCVAHALCELVEYHNREQEGTFTRFSTDFIYGLRFGGDYMGNGMYVRDALKNVQNYGDVIYKQLPGNSNVETAVPKVMGELETLKPLAYPNRISTYYRIRNVNELKYALSHDGPVVVGMWWYDDATVEKVGKYHTYNSEHYRHGNDNNRSGHAVLVVGYDDVGFIIQNSWGASWGDKGLFRVKYGQFDLFFDVFGVTDNISSIKKPNKLKSILGPFINKILRMSVKS